MRAKRKKSNYLNQCDNSKNKIQEAQNIHQQDFLKKGYCTFWGQQIC